MKIFPKASESGSVSESENGQNCFQFAKSQKIETLQRAESHIDHSMMVLYSPEQTIWEQNGLIETLTL